MKLGSIKFSRVPFDPQMFSFNFQGFPFSFVKIDPENIDVFQIGSGRKIIRSSIIEFLFIFRFE
jgi:hypothetical protein